MPDDSSAQESAQPPERDSTPTTVPPAPKRPSAPPKNHLNPKWLVVFVLMAMSTSAAILAWAPLGKMGPFLIGGGMLFIMFVGLNYFLWGWWLPQLIQSSESEAGDQDSSEP